MAEENLKQLSSLLANAKKLESQRRLSSGSFLGVVLIIILVFVFPDRITTATSDIIQTALLGLFSIVGIWMGLEGWLIQKGPKDETNGIS